MELLGAWGVRSAMHRVGKGPLVIKCPFTGQSVNKVEHGGNYSVRTVQAKDPWNNNGNQVSLRSKDT